MHVDLKHTLILINKIKEYIYIFFLEEKEYFA